METVGEFMKQKIHEFMKQKIRHVQIENNTKYGKD